MTIETVPFDAAEYLTTAEAQAELISDALESGNANYVAHALGVVARAQGMSELAEKAGLSREMLDDALKQPGDPKLSTLMGVAKALGIRLHASA